MLLNKQLPTQLPHKETKKKEKKNHQAHKDTHIRSPFMFRFFVLSFCFPRLCWRIFVNFSLVYFFPFVSVFVFFLVFCFQKARWKVYSKKKHVYTQGNTKRFSIFKRHEKEKKWTQSFVHSFVLFVFCCWHDHRKTSLQIMLSKRVCVSVFENKSKKNSSTSLIMT